jgi:hypothetical protein
MKKATFLNDLFFFTFNMFKNLKIKEGFHYFEKVNFLNKRFEARQLP